MIRHLAAEYASAAEPEASSSLPPARSRLLAQLQTLPPAVTDTYAATQSLPFANLAINPAICTGCGLCSRFCPTGALAFSARNGAFQINFAPSACVDCGICALACPSRALEYTGAVPVAALADGSQHLLVQGTIPPPQVSPQSRTGHAGVRASLFEQLAGAQRRPAHNHQNGGVARPSCQTEGVSA
jgi:ferredoxin